VNPLLAYLHRALVADEEAPRALPRAEPPSSAIFLILRRMRTPLVVLIAIYAVSVLGLTLVPGRDADGNPWAMGFFHAFYFMSYTATTIGFGEIPHAFTDAQRLWVTFSIYLTVIGWAYAIGTLLALVQDRAFRHTLAMQRFARKVRRLHEPFVLVAGYGQTGRMLGRSLDALGRRFVVVDIDATRIDDLELDAFRADVPGLVADARNPEHLVLAGLGHRRLEGVIALTNDDEANLAVAMAAAMLRPDVQVLARTVSRPIAERMRAFGAPSIVNPFDRFGDLLRVALRAPAAFRLMEWLTGEPGTELPPRREPPRGRWVICGYGRFGREVVADLRAEGLVVTIIEPGLAAADDPSIIVGFGTEPDVLARARLEDAVGFVAATDNDTTNLSLIVGASRRNPELFTIARQNDPANRPLFDALHIDTTLVPTRLVAAEVLARISDPMLWAFVQQAQQRDDRWAQPLLDRLVGACGPRRPALWTVDLTAHGAPAVAPRLTAGEVTLGALLTDPQDRKRPLDAVPLLVLRSGDSLVAPGDDLVLQSDDRILLAGMTYDRSNLDTTLCVPAAAEYVLTGDRVGASWLWRTLVDR
jgi:Trk K+ transport system NAD-binding subunit